MSNDCLFCKIAAGDIPADKVYEDDDVIAFRDIDPQAPVHVLVVPRRHIASLDQLDKSEMGDLLATVQQSVGLLKKVMKPDGFNVGLNLGKVAGAGVEEHLHFHIVPRWFGDTNALTVFGEVRVIPEHLKATYKNLKKHFNKIDIKP